MALSVETWITTSVHYLKKKKKPLAEWLKWQSNCLVNTGPEFNPKYCSPHKKQQGILNENKVSLIQVLSSFPNFPKHLRKENF
jgi:hypothetical protein